MDRDGPWREVRPAQADRFEAALQAAQQEQGLPGLAMAVADHRRHALWVGATGSARLAPEEAWTPDHRSRIGSVTKTFTSALIYQLVDEGVLSLDDAVEEWVDVPWEGVRVEHLLGHSSGIVSYNYVGSFDTSRAWTPDELVEWASLHGPELQFVPGTDWAYSNTNYVLLGLVLESATGESYEQLVQARLLGPRGLESLAMPDGSEPDDLVACYTAAHEDFEPFDPSFAWAAGGMIGGPADLARWSDALFLGDVIRAESRTAMTTPQGLTGEDESLYGLGAFVESDGEYTIYGHTGGIGGYLSYAYTLEDPPMTLVMLSNQEDTDLRQASGHGWAAILGLAGP